MLESPINMVQSDAESIRRQMAQFFEATSDGIQFLNRKFVITFMNARAKAILSPSGDVIGKNLWESFPQAKRPEFPYYASYMRTMHERVATEFEAFYPEPLNIWFHVHAYPSEDGIIVFFRDVTEEKRASAELLQKREDTENQLAEIEAVYRTAPIGLAVRKRHQWVAEHRAMLVGWFSGSTGNGCRSLPIDRSDGCDR